MVPVTGPLPERARGQSALWALNGVLVVGIVVLDWLTPAGVVVGILLGVPIIATAASDAPRLTWATFAAAIVGFLVAALYGRAPISPEEVWIPNRIFALLTLPASLALALHVQRRRRDAERARDEAQAASEINRLLVSLLAHDLRAPLAMGIQAVDYARGVIGAVPAEQDDLLGDVHLRLRRNLASIDGLLRFFREPSGGAGDVGGGDVDGADGDPVGVVDVGGELEREIEAFGSEASALGKPIRLVVGEDLRAGHGIDLLVFRQAVGILVDNALRHARPGPIDVDARTDHGALRVTVTDGGPALGSGIGDFDAASHGAGVGLALCRALVAQAGGTVDVTVGDGTKTRAALVLPLREPPTPTPTP